MKKLILIICLGCFLVACAQEQKIEVGQVWRYDCNSPKDPFKNEYIDYKVLDYKDGYVLYRNVKYSTHSYNNSNSESWFRTGSKLISPISDL